MAFQDPFEKFESINNLSGRKPFYFFSQSTRYFSAQLNPAFSLFSAFLSNSFYYLAFIEWVCHLKETLSSLMLLRLLIKGGSGCQRCSANWVVEKLHITEYEVTPVNQTSTLLKCATSYQHVLHCWLLVL